MLTTRVHGVSMAPALRDGDALLVDRVGVRFQAPERGDVVVTAEPGGGSLVKRVIAVPGDVVEIEGGGPRPVVLLQPGGRGPWRRLVEPYVGASWTGREFCCDARGLDTVGAPQPLRVPPGRLFLLGDNRDASTDSRRYGLFSTDQVVGRAVLRWWPLDRSGTIDGRPELAPA
jgi:signal peptidase I